MLEGEKEFAPKARAERTAHSADRQLSHRHKVNYHRRYMKKYPFLFIFVDSNLSNSKTANYTLHLSREEPQL